MFYSMRPDGQFDDFSLHGACPVTSGRKWAANKWVWTAPVNVSFFINACSIEKKKNSQRTAA
ncbi:unnamed protein product [Discosporangium mesarthrocarpum]